MDEAAGKDRRLPRGRDWRLIAGLLLVLVAAASFIGGFFLDWEDMLQCVQGRRTQLRASVAEHPVLASAIYFATYVVFTGLSLPGAAILTLIGGAVFGVWWATVLVSFASTAGATTAFLASRYLLRDRVQRQRGERLAAINRELDREGSFYLLSLRLNPVVPYFLINLLFGLTRLPAWQFWIVSQVGMLPATIIYANAGARLAEIESPGDILSGPLLASLIALSLFPIVAKKAANRLRREVTGSPNTTTAEKTQRKTIDE